MSSQLYNRRKVSLKNQKSWRKKAGVVIDRVPARLSGHTQPKISPDLNSEYYAISVIFDHYIFAKNQSNDKIARPMNFSTIFESNIEKEQVNRIDTQNQTNNLSYWTAC